MFVLHADKTRLTVNQREPITSGSKNVYSVLFHFSPDWNSLSKTAVFQCGEQKISVLLDGEECVIPWEVLTFPGRPLMAGVCGTLGENVVLPTVWAQLGTVLKGAVPGNETRPPTPDLWQQELERKGDRLDYTNDGELGLYSGEKLLSSVPAGDGGGAGATDHRRLSHRDAGEQHPIESISGLVQELARIPEPVEALTNTELEEILK